MTETEWLVSCDLTAMLNVLRGTASDRKMPMSIPGCQRPPS